MPKTTSVVLVIFLSMSILSGCGSLGPVMPGMQGVYSGGYNTTHVVNGVPCGPAGSLVSLNSPDSFDMALAADGMCMQWYALASFQECERLNRQAERQYAQTQMWASVGEIVLNKIDDNGRSRNKVKIDRPRQTRCQMPRIKMPTYRR